MAESLKTEIKLIKGRLTARIPSLLISPAAEIELRLGGAPVATAHVSERTTEFAEVSFALPEAAQSDGVALLDFHMLPEGTHLARYTLFCGDRLPDDPIAALALLQAEVQTLKRAFMTDAAVPKLTLTERPLLIAEAVEQSLAVLQQTPATGRSES